MKPVIETGLKPAEAEDGGAGTSQRLRFNNETQMRKSLHRLRYSQLLGLTCQHATNELDLENPWLRKLLRLPCAATKVYSPDPTWNKRN